MNLKVRMRSIFFVLILLISSTSVFSKVRVRLGGVVKKLNTMTARMQAEEKKIAKYEQSNSVLEDYDNELAAVDTSLAKELKAKYAAKKVAKDACKAARDRGEFAGQNTCIRKVNALSTDLMLLELSAAKVLGNSKSGIGKFLSVQQIKANNRKIKRANDKIARLAKSHQLEFAMCQETAGDKCGCEYDTDSKKVELVAGTWSKKQCKYNRLTKKRPAKYHADRKSKPIDLGKKLSEMAVSISTGFQSLIPKMSPGQTKSNCIHPDKYADLQRKMRAINKIARQYQQNQVSGAASQ